MKNKMLSILYVYMLPIMFAFGFLLLKELKINGDAASEWQLFAFGFFIGLSLEGVLAMLVVTWGIVTGKLTDV